MKCGMTPYIEPGSPSLVQSLHNFFYMSFDHCCRPCLLECGSGLGKSSQHIIAATLATPHNLVLSQSWTTKSNFCTYPWSPGRPSARRFVLLLLLGRFLALTLKHGLKSKTCSLGTAPAFPGSPCAGGHGPPGSLPLRRFFTRLAP